MFTTKNQLISKIKKNLFLKRFKQELKDLNYEIKIKLFLAHTCLHNAHQLVNEGNLEESIKLYKEVIDYRPHWVNVYIELGNVLTQIKQFDQAVIYYQEAINKKPHYAEAYFYQGNALQCLKKYETAISSYQKAIDLKLTWRNLFQNLQQCLLNFGDFLSSQNKNEKALEQYKDALEIDSDSSVIKFKITQILFKIAQDFAHQENFNEAINYLNQAAHFAPDWTDIYFFRGLYQQQRKEYQLAIQDYQKVLQSQPERVECYLNWGNALLEQFKKTEAINLFNKVISLKTDWAEAYFYRGNALQSKQKYKEAIEDYEHAISLNLDWAELYKNYATAIVNLGVKLEQSDKLEKIILKIYQLIENKKISGHELGKLYLRLGDLFFINGNYDKAIKNYQNVINLKLKDPNIYAQISHSILALSHKNKSQNIVEKIKIELCEFVDQISYSDKNKHLPEFYFHLANLLLQQGQYAKALEYHYKALTLKKDWSAQAYFSLGYFPLVYQRHLEGMQKIYQQALTLNPDWIEGYYEAGNWLMHSGHFDAAMEFWQQVPKVQFRLAEANDIDIQGIHIFGADFTRNIGHICLLDYHIKMDILGWRSLNHGSAILVLPKQKVANQCLLNYWNSYLPIVHDLSEETEITQLLPYAEEYMATVTLSSGKTLYYYEALAKVQKEWETQKRPPLLRLSDEDNERGKHRLQQLGLPENAWFVCLHVRELPHAPNKMNVSSRDADINTYLLAMETIVKHGGWIIRMGSPTMTPLAPMKQVIDYAHSPLKSDWMDVFLWSQCRFSIGTNSGPYIVPSLFGIPSVITNWLPLGTPPHFGNSIFIPKLLWSEDKNRYLSFEEMISLPFGIEEHSQFYPLNRLQVRDNTPEDINDLILEVIEMIEQKQKNDENSLRLQNKIRNLFIKHKPYECNSQIGNRFLNQYSYLL